MLEYTLLHWTTFLVAVALLELSPGADMAFMLSQTVRNGRKAGFAALFGSMVATLFHILLAAIGLSAVLATSAVAFSLVKWCGVMYLLWLGLQAFKSSQESASRESANQESENPASSRAIFLQGMFICALNPKVAIFFMAFLPQFVVEGAGPIAFQFLFHGIVMVVVGLLLQTPLILLGSRIAEKLKGNRRIGTWMDRCLGAVFIALGVRLAISKMN